MVQRAKTNAEARKIRDKVNGDMEAAVGVALRVTRLIVNLVVTPKIELAKKVIRAVANEE